MSYNIDESTNSITKAVLSQGEALKGLNRDNIVLRTILGIEKDKEIDAELIKSLDGVVLDTSKLIQQPSDG